MVNSVQQGAGRPAESRTTSRQQDVQGEVLQAAARPAGRRTSRSPTGSRASRKKSYRQQDVQQAGEAAGRRSANCWYCRAGDTWAVRYYITVGSGPCKYWLPAGGKTRPSDPLLMRRPSHAGHIPDFKLYVFILFKIVNQVVPYSCTYFFVFILYSLLGFESLYSFFLKSG